MNLELQKPPDDVTSVDVEDFNLSTTETTPVAEESPAEPQTEIEMPDKTKDAAQQEQANQKVTLKELANQTTAKRPESVEKDVHEESKVQDGIPDKVSEVSEGTKIEIVDVEKATGEPDQEKVTGESVNTGEEVTKTTDIDNIEDKPEEVLTGEEVTGDVTAEIVKADLELKQAAILHEDTTDSEVNEIILISLIQNIISWLQIVFSICKIIPYVSIQILKICIDSIFSSKMKQLFYVCFTQDTHFTKIFAARGIDLY